MVSTTISSFPVRSLAHSLLFFNTPKRSIGEARSGGALLATPGRALLGSFAWGPGLSVVFPAAARFPGAGLAPSLWYQRSGTADF
jgi:hypothetical protein